MERYRKSMRLLLIVGASVVMLGGLLVSNVAFAGHNEPEEAEDFQSALVRAFAECIANNTTTPNLGLLACSPSVPLDPHCGIDPKEGKGTVEAKVLPGDIRLQVDGRGLTKCDEQILDLMATVRVTTDNCEDGNDCTPFDLSLPIGSCEVEGGECEIDTTVNEALGQVAFGEGNNAGLEILGCGLFRRISSSDSVQTLSCGLLVK